LLHRQLLLIQRISSLSGLAGHKSKVCAGKDRDGLVRGNPGSGHVALNITAVDLIGVSLIQDE